MGIGAAIAAGAVASVAGSAISANAAGDAASLQAGAANNAAAVQQHMYDLTRGDLAPFRTGGASAFNSLLDRLPQLSSTFNPTTAQLEQTPGYRFQMDQGLKSVQNSYAAKGLANSGAALKGAAGFTTGLAQSTWMDQLKADMSQKLQQYNMLLSPAQLGENAAAQTGNAGTQAGSGIANSLITAGGAQAAGTIGGANALAGGLGNIGNLISQYPFLNRLLGQGSGGSTGGLYGNVNTSGASQFGGDAWM